MAMPVGAGAGERWQLFMWFRGRTGQMDFHWFAFGIDAFKIIKRDMQ